jgi:hypothetical protein
MLDYILIIALALLVFWVPFSHSLKARRAKSESLSPPPTPSSKNDEGQP